MDSRVIMVQERLLESLLQAPAEEQSSISSSSSSSSLLQQSTGDKDDGRSAPVSMDVDGEGGDSSGASGAGGETTVVSDTSKQSKNDIPTAIQVVASMVDSVLQVRTVLLFFVFNFPRGHQDQEKD